MGSTWVLEQAGTVGGTIGRRAARVAAVAFAIAVAGCGGKKSSEPLPRGSLNDPSVNADIINAIFDQQAANAVATERVVYPYHFVPHDDTLNTIGLEHVEALATTYRPDLDDRPLRISVARGAESDELYAARVVRVREQLDSAGVVPDRVTLLEEPAGGRGVSTEQFLRAERAREQSGGRQARGGGTTGSAGNSAGGTGAGAAQSQTGGQSGRGR